MNNRPVAHSDSSALVSELDRLWVGLPLPCPAPTEASEQQTYLAYEPAQYLASPAAGDFGWLRAAGEPPTFDGQSVTSLATPVFGVPRHTPLQLTTLAERLGDDAPDDLKAFAASDLPSLVPTVADCYLDLAHLVVDVPGGRLLHLLADSQGVLHWLLHLADDGTQAILCTDEWFGYDLGAETPTLDPDHLPLLAVVAGSFTEFIWRFWLDNTIWLLHEAGLPLSPTEQAYVDALEPLT